MFLIACPVPNRLLLPAVRILFTVYACGAFTGGFLIAASGSNNKIFGLRGSPSAATHLCSGAPMHLCSVLPLTPKPYLAIRQPQILLLSVKLRL
jgi:hypothetical protein